MWQFWLLEGPCAGPLCALGGKLRGKFAGLVGFDNPTVAPEMANFPPHLHAYVRFCNTFTKKRGQAFFDAVEKIMQSRTQTMIHGDLDVGNLWASQTRAATFVFTDWQMLRMGPIGFDLCKLLLTSTIEVKDAQELLRSYHASLPSHIQAEYGYSALYDDVRIMATCCHMYLTVSVATSRFTRSITCSLCDFAAADFRSPCVLRNLGFW